MRADALMVIMKILSNNRGAALVVLIVAMTLIAILGASFVSFMGVKQRGFLYQINSYRALNIANAGVEYAIGCAAGIYELQTSSTNLSTCMPVVNSEPSVTNLSDTTQWKSYSFGDGRIYLSYLVNPSIPDDIQNNKVLFAVGSYGESIRQIRLKRFLAYASESATNSGRVKLLPGNAPRVSIDLPNLIIVPLINVYYTDITVQSLTLTVGSTKNLIRIYQTPSLRETPPISSMIYVYTSFSQTCDPTPCGSPSCIDPPCKTATELQLPTTSWAGRMMDHDDFLVPAGAIRWIYLELQAGTAISDTYTLTLTYSVGASSEIASHDFSL